MDLQSSSSSFGKKCTHTLCCGFTSLSFIQNAVLQEGMYITFSFLVKHLSFCFCQVKVIKVPFCNEFVIAIKEDVTKE